LTAERLAQKALLLLGYNGTSDGARLDEAVLNGINRVYADLFFLNKSEGFREINELSQVLDLDERLFYDVAPYGVASFIALSLGDTDSENILAAIYNKKRKKLSAQGTVEDVLPTV
jgi:hypothetical protein